ncbi:hypothetical protein HPP05_43695, partial [Corallococcus exiguus]|nr:hypothetical protein [Corallococcus exiguus]
VLPDGTAPALSPAPRTPSWRRPQEVSREAGARHDGARRGLTERQLLKGDVFLFVGRCRKRAKVLHFDGTGLVLLTKRLFRGRF